MSVVSVLVAALVTVPLSFWTRRAHAEAALLPFLIFAVAEGILARIILLRSDRLPNTEGLLGVRPWEDEGRAELQQPARNASFPHTGPQCDPSSSRMYTGLADPDPWDAVEGAGRERAATMSRWLKGARSRPHE